MSSRQSFFTFRECFLLAGLLLFVVPPGRAQGRTGAEGKDPEGSVAQAQATLSSLFGKKATLPIPPRVNGTIALPSFDSKDFRVDEEWVRGRKDSEEKQGPGQ